MEGVPEKCEYGNLELDHIYYDEEADIVHAYFIRPIKSLIMKFTIKSNENN
jgi:hypothetical protein